ncbi:MAG: hypothetical protein ACR2RV_27485, partial [Verrucomicrobiales bacterium]
LGPVGSVLEIGCAWRNCSTTTFKKISERLEGNRVIRRHEKEPPRPYQRSIDHCRESGDGAAAQALEKWRSGLDPFGMKAEIEWGLARLWELYYKLPGTGLSHPGREASHRGPTVLEGHLR